MRPQILFPAVLITLVVLVVVSDVQRRQAQVQLRDMSLLLAEQGGEEAQREMAAEIIARVRTHMALDEDVEPTVATIVDVARLREQNAFYDKAENGDFLLVTSTRAILYRASDDKILDVMPVQLDRAPPSAEAEEEEAVDLPDQDS